jgi:hypothetical protein
MILHFFYLGIGLLWLQMESTESTEDPVAICYDEQKRLEQEEQDKLLAREPGETEEDAVPRADILDVSMEEQEVAHNSSSIRDGSESSVTNPNRGELLTNSVAAAVVATGIAIPVPAPDPKSYLNRGGEGPGAGSTPAVGIGNDTDAENKIIDTGTDNKVPNTGGCGAHTGTGEKGKNTTVNGDSNTTNLIRGDVITGTGTPNPNGGGLSNKTKLYLAAKTNASSATVPNLAGGGRVPVLECGSFIIPGDNRFEKITLRSDVNAGKNTSYSFDPDTMACSCCGQFRTRGGGG